MQSRLALRILLPALAGILLAAAALADVPVDEAHFPDGVFRAYVLEQFDTDGSGALDGDEIAGAKAVDCFRLGVSSLAGIEYLTALETLDCQNNSLTALDLSANPKLTYLGCSSNQLTALDLSANPKLTRLYCGGNQLTALDLSANSELTELFCHKNSLTIPIVNGQFQLSGLPLFDPARASGWQGGAVQDGVLTVDAGAEAVTYTYDCGNGFTADFRLVPVAGAGPADVPVDEAHFPDGVFRAYVLEQFDTDGSGALDGDEIAGAKAVDCFRLGVSSLAGIEYLTAMETLDCQNNSLTALDLSANPALTWLNCGRNQLTALDLSANPALTSLNCGGNQLTALDLSANPALTSLSCDGNQLTALVLSANPKLTYLDCSGNQLTALDLSANPALTSLHCYFNQLTALDLSANPSLTNLYCFKNQLTALNLSANPELTKLDCGGNQLTALDLSANPALTSLNCGRNQLTALDLSANPALTSLSCDGNQLTALDLSANSELADLSCDENSRTISVVNGQFWLSGLPDFDPARASGWQGGAVQDGVLTVDAGAEAVTYTYDCGNGFTADFRLVPVAGAGPADVSVDEAHFPDGVFRAYVLEQFDTDGSGALGGDEIAGAKAVDCFRLGVSSLAGIEYLTALETLDCQINSLTALDLSANPSLTNLYCGGNQLTALVLSANPALTELNCRDNRLTALDLSANPELTELDCDENSLTIPVVNGQFRLSGLPLFDPARASGWQGGAVQDGVLTVDAGAEAVTYTYDCGNGFTVDFRLVPDETPGGYPPPPVYLPASLKRIESGAFAGAKIAAFLLPDGITAIAGDAFDPNVVLYYRPGTGAEAYCREHAETLPRCLPYEE